MIYLNDTDIGQLNDSWKENIDVIRETIDCIINNDYAQPVKPYLRYKNPNNRIIAMPAFVGGKINMSGIKWIASFPENVAQNLPRAHSVVILNESDTGVPIGVLNSGKISAIRTASVSGLVIDRYMKSRNPERLKLGIVGFGPIGQQHLSMCHEILGEQCADIFIYDLKNINLDGLPNELRTKIKVVKSWRQAYDSADIFITCTVSKERYIDTEPKPGSLHLNVSLRDYKPEVFSWFSKSIIVDNWEEVCREETDVERFHLDKGLQAKDVYSLNQLVSTNLLGSFDKEQAIMFNPMGMAVFDIGISKQFIDKANVKNLGVSLTQKRQLAHIE